MYITVTNTESVYNRAKMRKESIETVSGKVYVNRDLEKALKVYAPRYQMSVAQLVEVALSFYFGDGQNHLNCEYCEFWRDCECKMPEVGENATLPLLDKGSVVVGLPLNDQGL